MWTQPEVSGMLSWPTGLTPPLVDSGPRQALSAMFAGGRGPAGHCGSFSCDVTVDTFLMCLVSLLVVKGVS